VNSGDINIWQTSKSRDRQLGQKFRNLTHSCSACPFLLFGSSNRCENVVTEEEDRRQEEEHITSALKKCNYPAWSIRKAKKDMQNKSDKRIKRASQKKS